jgi:hypothetical protein
MLILVSSGEMENLFKDGKPRLICGREGKPMNGKQYDLLSVRNWISDRSMREGNTALQ